MSDTDPKPIFILTGGTGSGKTTFLLQMLAFLRRHDLFITGFAAVSDPGDGPSAAYDIMDLSSGKTLPLAARKSTRGWRPHGSFYFNPEGLQMGERILENALIRGADLMVVDEIGPFELEGKIWAKSLSSILHSRSCPVLLVVREKLVQQVIRHWHLEDARVVNIREKKPDQAANEVIIQKGISFE